MNVSVAMTRSLPSPGTCCHASCRIRGLKRFWDHRGQDGIDREKQLLIDFLCANSGGPMYYTGRDMKVSHKGMKINEADWTAFMGHVNATLDVFKLPPTERGEVVGFVQSLKKDIVEA